MNLKTKKLIANRIYDIALKAMWILILVKLYIAWPVTVYWGVVIITFATICYLVIHSDIWDQ